ncbi:hypothetical protein HanRHA438_Chr17g0823901 [Helianthus annuus]|nr:hypothetical protein HanRHA438_Chr17g0823901 [Helianthus annuus]
MKKKKKKGRRRRRSERERDMICSLFDANGCEMSVGSPYIDKRNNRLQYLDTLTRLSYEVLLTRYLS